jgi:hypothetical protein
MMNKTFVAAATALSIGLGAIAATTTTASAANFQANGYISGPGFSIGFGDQRPGRHWQGRSGWNRHCEPVFRYHRVFLPHRGWVVQRFQVGQRCHKIGHRPHWGWR